MRACNLIPQLVLSWVTSLIRSEAALSVWSPQRTPLPISWSPWNRYVVPLFQAPSRLVGFLLALFVTIVLCVDAMAQSHDAPRQPDTTEAPDTPNFSKVCPGKTLFPPSSGPRGSYANGWQQDYPAVVFDARNGVSYWLDYSPSPSLVRFDSIFTPVTYTTEKVLVLICGLHFNATASAVPTTQAVPDGGPQIDLAAAALSPPSPAAPPAIGAQAKRVPPPPPPPPLVNPCPGLDKAAKIRTSPMTMLAPR